MVLNLANLSRHGRCVSAPECVDDYDFLVILPIVTFVKRHVRIFNSLFLCWQFTNCLKREENKIFF